MSKKIENYEQKNISKYMKSNESITTIDKEHTRALTSPNKIKVIETNMPSSQALRNFSLKLMQIKARLESGEK